ncbi:hypothetical protein RI129_002869 [Pyrocoelia pectoralis]|uniref:Uncharacterized protein n=1 Tax=Pyrocoelia pectoralis TaxID=417401 RepID=A0AAN7ZMK0_9COLE
MRHLTRKHNDEMEVINILKLPIRSKERRKAFAMLRNNINFDLYINGVIKPNRYQEKTKNYNTLYFPCVYCKGIFTKQYLKRHNKSCFVKNNNSKSENRNILARSQTLVACAMDPNIVISKLNVKEKVFDLMKPDKIAFEAKKDLLISNYGESYLKKHKRERMIYSCSNRMRELSRLLIKYREISNDEKISLTDIFHPKNFDNVLFATRRLVVCDELTHLILKQSPGFRCKSLEQANIWLRNVENFRKLIESRWNIEMASLANKELQEKKWNKPLLLPLVSDIKKFRDEVTKLAENAIIKLSSGTEDKKSYKLLCDCTLSLLILFNRRRIDDVQYLKIENYTSEKKSNYTDFQNALTEAEKKLTQNYRRILNSGKGSRAVVILIPKEIDKIINVLLKYRNHRIKWGKGDVAIRNLCKKIDLQNPNAISSNKLRKQIATVTQILNLKPEESKQFSNFMGHTQKTHDEFYELPVDIYQTAKVSKLLLMMEKGTIPLEYKGKSLEEINLNFNVEEVEEDELDKNCNGCTGKLMIPQISLKQKPNHNLLGSSSDEKENVSSTRSQQNKNKKIKKWQRNCWSNKELHLLKKEFNSYINKGCYPPGEDIKVFITKTGIQRTIVTIKSKIQHLINIKKKLKNFCLFFFIFYTV